MICAGNWKLNKGPTETEKFLSELLNQCSAEDQKNLILFTPTLNLTTCAQKLKGSSVGWGPQNIYWEREGAFTGENSPKEIAQLGATHCLVGHSERRALFGETDSQVAQKIQSAQDEDMIPMICVGETLAERKSDQVEAILQKQLQKGLAEYDPKKGSIIVAYEPVWAIGTGEVATPEQAQEAHAFIKKQLEQIGGAAWAQKTSVLYGGSVKPENATSLAIKENVDGFLVGGASLKVESFLDIYRNSLK